MRDGVAGLEIAEDDGGHGLASCCRSPRRSWTACTSGCSSTSSARTSSATSSSRAAARSSAALRVAIAFADLAGYTRLTEEAGEEEALDVVERFVESVEDTLPDEARVIKTIGDEVMVVGADPAALVDWAVGFQAAQRRPAAAAADRHARRRRALPRRRLLRPRGQPRLARGRARGGRRGAGDRRGRRGGRRPPRVRADRRGQAQGLQRGHRALPGDGAAWRPPSRSVVLLSPAGATRSACSTSPCGGEAVTALHVNYGLRPSADEDEAFCRELCERLGVPLRGPPRRPARRATCRPGRARCATREAAQARGRWWPPATRPPTRSRPCSTAWPPRRAGARCSASATAAGRDPPAAGLDARGDRGVLPRARAGVARGREQRRPATSRATGSATSCCPRCARSTRPPRRTSCARWRSCATRPRCSTSLIDTEPSVRADRRAAAGAAAADGAGDRRGARSVGARADEILALGSRGGTATLDLGGGLRAVVEYGRLRFDHGPSRAAAAGAPGGARRRRVRRRPRRLRARRRRPAGRRRARRPSSRCAPGAPGDRMRLPARRRSRTCFTDRKVPRERRHQLPVVVSDGEIAWAIGIVGERFRATRVDHAPRRD